jgi:hypothetical protein
MKTQLSKPARGRASYTGNGMGSRLKGEGRSE